MFEQFGILAIEPFGLLVLVVLIIAGVIAAGFLLFVLYLAAPILLIVGGFIMVIAGMWPGFAVIAVGLIWQLCFRPPDSPPSKGPN